MFTLRSGRLFFGISGFFHRNMHFHPYILMDLINRIQNINIGSYHLLIMIIHLSIDRIVVINWKNLKALLSIAWGLSVFVSFVSWFHSTYCGPKRLSFDCFAWFRYSTNPFRSINHSCPNLFDLRMFSLNNRLMYCWLYPLISAAVLTVINVFELSEFRVLNENPIPTSLEDFWEPFCLAFMLKSEHGQELLYSLTMRFEMGP